MPEGARFRIIYCATRPAGAFGETIARYRRSPKLLAALQQIEDDEPLDPELKGGVVPKAFRLERPLGIMRLANTLRFADFQNPETFTILREELAEWLVRLGLEDFDLSAATSPLRRLTQEAALYVYQLAEAGFTNFAGIRYLSRLNPKWELWALFQDRMDHLPKEVAGVIRKDAPELQEAAHVLGLEIG